MRENFGDEWATARVEGVIVGKGATKKVRVRWTNLKVPEEIEYRYNHNIFKDPSAEPRKKAPKIDDQSQIAPLPAGGGAAVSNDEGSLELYPSDPEVSEAEDEADGSAGIFSLKVGGNQWCEDEALNLLDPRGHMVEAIQNPIFTLPSCYHRKIELDLVDYVDLFFHKLLFSTMVEHTNSKISDDAQKVAEVEMRSFVGLFSP